MKKMIAVLICLLLLVSVCSSCGSEQSRPSDNTTTPTQSQLTEEQGGIEQESTEKEGLDEVQAFASLEQVSSTGQIPYDLYRVYTIDYAEKRIVGDVKTDLFPFYYNGLYGYADATGKVVIPEQFDRAEAFSEGKALVDMGEFWGVIDEAGQVLASLPKEANAVDTVFQNGKAVIAHTTGNDNDASMYGTVLVTVVYDDLRVESNRILIAKSIYESISDVRTFNTPEFSGVMVAAWLRDENREGYYKYTLYDLTGAEVWSVNTKSHVGDSWISATGGNLITSDTQLLDCFYIHDGYMNVVNEKDKWGLLDLQTNSQVIPYRYDFVGCYAENKIAVCSYEKWGYVTESGEEAFALSYNYTDRFVNDRAIVVTQEDTLCVIDASGEVVSEIDLECKEYLKISAFSEKSGVAVVTFGRSISSLEVHIINSNGEVLESCYEPNDIYVSDNYVFMDGEMYKIQF